MAAATTLVDANIDVTVYEAARTLGGRARRIRTHNAATHIHEPKDLDNGQHLLLGAYGDTLQLIKKMGIDPTHAFLPLPLQIVYPDRWRFIAPALPAPLHTFFGLIFAQGMCAHHKYVFIKKLWQTYRQHWQLPSSMRTVDDWLKDQPIELQQRLWIPLCLATLNTHPTQACGQTFLNVLRDSVGAKKRAHSTMLLPRHDLSALFPEAAALYLHNHGGHIQLGKRITHMTFRNAQWHLTQDPAQPYDGLVLAGSPNATLKLLKNISPETTAFSTHIQTLSELCYEGIITIYLVYPGMRLPRPFYALNTTHDAPGQFVFDRGYLMPEHAGMMAIVISAPNAQQVALDHATLAQSVHKQLCDAFHWKTPYTWWRVIHEKYATFRCEPNMKRLRNDPTQKNTLVIASDLVAKNKKTAYPATLEGAVRSGIEAGKIMADLLKRTVPNN